MSSKTRHIQKTLTKADKKVLATGTDLYSSFLRCTKNDTEENLLWCYNQKTLTLDSMAEHFKVPEETLKHLLLVEPTLPLFSPLFLFVDDEQMVWPNGKDGHMYGLAANPELWTNEFFPWGKDK